MNQTTDSFLDLDQLNKLADLVEQFRDNILRYNSQLKNENASEEELYELLKKRNQEVSDVRKNLYNFEYQHMPLSAQISYNEPESIENSENEEEMENLSLSATVSKDESLVVKKSESSESSENVPKM